MTEEDPGNECEARSKNDDVRKGENYLVNDLMNEREVCEARDRSRK